MNISQIALVFHIRFKIWVKVIRHVCKSSFPVVTLVFIVLSLVLFAFWGESCLKHGRGGRRRAVRERSMKIRGIKGWLLKLDKQNQRGPHHFWSFSPGEIAKNPDIFVLILMQLFSLFQVRILWSLFKRWVKVGHILRWGAGFWIWWSGTDW